MSATDPYLTLGVAPNADEAAIRAAYRAAMKRYHPDQNPSADAAERAREVAAAYKVLSDPEQRARFDRQRVHREQVIAPRPPQPPRSAPRGRLFGALLVFLSIGIVAFAVMKLDAPRPPGMASQTPVDREAASNPSPEAVPPVAPPATPPATDRVPPKLAEASPPPAPPVELTPQPPTMAKRGLPRPPTEVPTGPLVAKPPRASAPQPLTANRPASAQLAAEALKPRADDCDTASTCARIDLAALDRMQTLLYNQSYLNASAAKQARLLSGRSTFLIRLGRCTSAACKRDAYLARNREIAELMRS